MRRVYRIQFQLLFLFLSSLIACGNNDSTKNEVLEKDHEHKEVGDRVEGKTHLSQSAIKSGGIIVERAGPQRIKTSIKVIGKISLNQDRLQSISPRYPGVIREVRKQLGEDVSKGEVLVIVESNESLQRYEVKSSFSGTVIEKRGVVGSFIKEGDPVYIIADLSSVMGDFIVNRSDAAKVQLGQQVGVYSIDNDRKMEGQVSYISPIAESATQGVLVRAELVNEKREWRPGAFVSGEILIEDEEVKVGVKSKAVQTIDKRSVVFIEKGESFETAVIELGKKGETFTEVVEGLKPGEMYVSENSFLIKADIEKSSVSHEH